MPLSFQKKLNLSRQAIFPLDFYRFKHTVETLDRSGKNTEVSKPLWIVGVSPFDEVLLENEGHVVHIGEPSFTARWCLDEDRVDKIVDPTYYDEDLNMVIYDVIPLAQKDLPPEEWLLEAACAVGYFKGLIAMAPSEELH